VAGIDSFRAGLRSAVRALWNGTFTFGEFVRSMDSTIQRRLTQAYNEGAAVCGVLAAELTEEERIERQRFISNQVLFVGDFGLDIQENPQGVGLLRTHFKRIELWVNQYPSIAERGKAAACGDRKMLWQIDPRKDSCPTCLALNGKVRRASWWRQNNLRPRNAPNPSLDCEGWACGCELSPTDLQASRGPMPRVP
jgi:hypothetical protein